MKQFLKYKRIYFVSFALSASIFFLSQCISQNDKIKATITAPVYEDYAGSEKCASCHKDIYDQYVKTSHHLTSTPADEKNIRGSFEQEKNIFSYGNLLIVGMEKSDSGLYQKVYYKNEEKKSMRFDIVIGSGKIGQSYLTRRQNLFFRCLSAISPQPVNGQIVLDFLMIK